MDWFDARGPRVPADADRRVVLFPDTYTNYTEPAVGRATVRVLEAAGVHVAVPGDLGASGRPAYSLGFLDEARERAQATVEALAPQVADGWEVVFVEPSDAAMLTDEYADLLPESSSRASIAAASSSVCEYLDRHRLVADLPTDAPDERLVYHGHCNQKALGTDHHAVGVLRRTGYAVEPLDSGCCGMAGSFGYEAEHLELSRAIGRILFDQVDAADGRPVAPGASCRTQLGDRPGADRPQHPIQAVADALDGE